MIIVTNNETETSLRLGCSRVAGFPEKGGDDRFSPRHIAPGKTQKTRVEHDDG